MQNLTLESFRLNVRVGPYGIEQLVLGHQAAGTLDQTPQHAVCLGRQHDALIVS
jgi:hypothetical protein